MYVNYASAISSLYLYVYASRLDYKICRVILITGRDTVCFDKRRAQLLSVAKQMYLQSSLDFFPFIDTHVHASCENARLVFFFSLVSVEGSPLGLIATDPSHMYECYVFFFLIFFFKL